jgi:radical SAM protein with 4Fe4S-binding SPASM domain
VEPDFKQLKRMITILLEQAQIRYITLTGGEPFMHRDILKIIRFINDLGPGVMIISNGGMITPQVAARLKTMRVHYIQVTLGGADADTHDALCGDGTFRKLNRAVSCLRDAGITVGGSYLCTAHNYTQAGKVFDLFAGFDVKQVAFNRFNPSGESRRIMLSLMPTRSQVLTALAEVEQKAARYRLRVVSTMPLPPCVFDAGDFPHLEFGNCSAGTDHAQFAIGTNGNVRLCTLQKNAIGSLLETPLNELIHHRIVQNFRSAIPGFCKECPLAPGCLGGCGAAAEWVFGTADELDPFLAQHVMEDFKERVKA